MARRKDFQEILGGSADQRRGQMHALRHAVHMADNGLLSKREAAALQTAMDAAAQAEEEAIAARWMS